MKNKNKKTAPPEKLNEDKDKTRLEINRRNFLKTGGLTLAGLTAPLSLTGCYRTPTEIYELPAIDFPADTATVGIVRNDDIEEMVRAAIDLAGGLEDISHGDTVVIKPNITWSRFLITDRAFTHPEVLPGTMCNLWYLLRQAVDLYLNGSVPRTNRSSIPSPVTSAPPSKYAPTHISLSLPINDAFSASVNDVVLGQPVVRPNII